MANKEIYNNGSSSLNVEFDGDIVRLIQILDGEVIDEISLYDHELEDVCSFVQTVKFDESLEKE